MFQHFVAQYIYVFHPFVLHEVGKAFALYTGHVEDIGIGYYFLAEVSVLHVFNAMATAVNFIFFRHFQLIGGDEMESGIEVAHCHQQRMHGAAVFEVANKENVQILQRTLRFVDGVEVEHRLRRVLVGSVSGVDDRHGGYFTGIAGGSFQVVPHHDDIGIVTHHLDGVFQGLSL